MSVELPDDDVRTYSPEEQLRWSRNLEALTTRVNHGEFLRDASPSSSSMNSMPDSSTGFEITRAGIKIHPFEDGNGRVGRLLLSVILVRLGFRPIPLEVPKQEYLQAINVHHERGDIEPLLDLMLRLASVEQSPT